MDNIGKWGEDIVVEWLSSRDYRILHQRWHCRWGEIDIIAQESNSLTIVFVEVKTRSLRNWDENGLLAISEGKQAKLWQTAALFSSKYPHFADLPCRFDVALVSYQKYPTQKVTDSQGSSELPRAKPIKYRGYQFTIKRYLQDAF